MYFSVGWFLVTFVVTTVGYGFFLYGKKQARLPPLVAGLVLMIYPGFVPWPWLILLIAGAVLGSLWLGTRAGL
jgi:hypothetical protein